MRLDAQREWRTPEAKLVWVLRAALAALTLFALSAQPKYTTRPLLVLSAVAGLVASALFVLLPTRRPRTLKGAEAVALVAFTLHVCGHAFGLYEHLGWYDKALHVVESGALALVLFALSQATRWVWHWTDVRPFEVAVYVFAIVVTAGVFWEIAEFGMDTFFHTQEQNGNTDTMLDLLADTTGALLGSLVAAWMTHVARAEGPQAVSEAPRRRATRSTRN